MKSEIKKLRVELGERSYDIDIGRGILETCLGEVKSEGGKVFILTDKNVAEHYLARVEDILRAGGNEVQSLTVPDGEASKSFENLKPIFALALSAGITRKDLFVTLGGGVVGDLGGFAASIYLRGVPFIQIPTSLLAQVDSSVGGKVAVDLPQGKNLVGSFYQPQRVIIDTALLDTLPNKFLCDGMGEIVKYGCIADAGLFATLENISSREEFYGALDDIIYACCDIKRGFVESDECDKGERMRLNFGHTFGHALEKFFGFERYTHGNAVAIGMCYITRITEAEGMSEAGTSKRLCELCAKFGLPTQTDADAAEVCASAANDKKMAGECLKLIVLKRIGESFIYPTKLSFLLKGSDGNASDA